MIIIVFLLVQSNVWYRNMHSMHLNFFFTITGIHSILFVRTVAIYADKTLHIIVGYLSKEENLMQIYYQYVCRQTLVRVSCVSMAHHQEVQLYECNNWYLLVIYRSLFVVPAGLET